MKETTVKGPTRGMTKHKRSDSAVLLYETGSFSSNLVNVLGREIVSGAYVEGAVLPNETAMRDRFGISRTALREAYSKLTAKGLVEARPRVGTSVRPRVYWNMLDHDVLAWHLQTVPADELASDLYALRRMIEPAAAELAAKTRSQGDIANIRKALEAMKRHATEEAALVEADFNFHVAILTATKNPFISAFSSLIRAAMLSVFSLSWRGAEVIKEHRLMQHEMVAEAIESGRHDLARQRMEQLLDESMEDAKAAAEGSMPLVREDHPAAEG
ncbi:MAG: FadR/GntR family transcriptional regulator [Roseitalea porphyridii]|uniref:FadR/GntR family transcriptional regulator n=1 Tax=Roseitalea porphyridii TaxID=1852022 RepID=UPI0032F01D28